MREFLRQIKAIVDELAGIGCGVKADEYVDDILEGFPQDYAPVISIIESKFEMPPLMEVGHFCLPMSLELPDFKRKLFHLLTTLKVILLIQDCLSVITIFVVVMVVTPLKGEDVIVVAVGMAYLPISSVKSALNIVTQPMFAST